ncbi:MAG: TIGR03619 family F420-dependent LLM class oxidoreductase, partial [Chloroflexi bacterium]|nr:TIGR03619 family F420-dependent LLM class oxidoreductase [Chloroflexota bacterium]
TDPYIALARASGATSKIMLGTGITLVPERNPILLAKEIASLDRFSGGRFLFGIGTGWLKEETEMMGGDFEHRWTQTREAIEVMKELWTKDEAEYHGRYFDFPLVRSYPKPLQKPYPPIILGGMAKNVLRRVVAHADGWLPNRVTPAQVEESRKKLDAMAAEAGRDPKSITISVYGQLPERDIVRSLIDAGADRVVVRPEHVETEKEMGEQLERMAEAVLR